MFRYISFFLIILVYIAAPTKPLNLAATTTDTNAILSWNPPTFNGGREDLSYIVKYKASQEQQFPYYSLSLPITDTSVTVTSLAPLTMYTFMIVAENEISQEFADQFSEDDRTSSPIFVTTQEGGYYIETMYCRHVCWLCACMCSERSRYKVNTMGYTC